MKDFLGQEIQIGDTIVYPGRHASRLWMNKAKVIGLKANGIKVMRDDGVVKVVKRLDRVVVVENQHAAV